MNRFFCSSSCGGTINQSGLCSTKQPSPTFNNIPDTFDGMISWYRLQSSSTPQDQLLSPPPKSPEDSAGTMFQVKRVRVPAVKVRKNSSVAAAAARRKQIQSTGDKSLWPEESYAVVKLSGDPQKDFKESMMEMIVEKRINCKNALEELLACYLLLNSDEYHGLIINVFQQIWFDLLP